MSRPFGSFSWRGPPKPKPGDAEDVENDAEDVKMMPGLNLP